MRRILFVDDEPKVLEGLQRILRPQRHQWEMAFAPGGEAALKLLASSPFDVIISDMRMPGMDGAALLAVVRERFPNVVRIVLTGYTELEAALRAVPVAHQFLLKPCDPGMLRVAVERACSLKAILTSDALCHMVGSLSELPALPRTYDALVEALSRPDPALDDIASIVERDVAIAAKVLQLVTTAFFGVRNDVASVRSAVGFIGLNVLKDLVLSVGAFAAFEASDRIDGFSLEDLETHAQLTARIAARLPKPSHLNDAAVAAALLHDVGKLVLASRLPEQFARALARAREARLPLYLAEQELLGVTHGEVGAYLLGLWGMPSPIVEAVAHHHAPMRVPPYKLDALAAVHIANALAHEYPAAPSRGGPLPDASMDSEYIEALGVAGQIPAWRVMAEEASRELLAAMEDSQHAHSARVM